MTHRVEQLAENISLHRGDAREILPTLGRVDAVLTDPPYGVLSENWDDMSRRELARFTMSWVGLVGQSTDRAAIFFGEKTRSVVAPLLEMAFEDVRQLIWNKQGGSVAEDKVFYSFESIFYCHRNETFEVVGPKSLELAKIISSARAAAGLSRGAVDVLVRGKKTGLCYRWEEGACLPTCEQVAVIRPVLRLDARFDEVFASATAERDTTLVSASALARTRAARLLDVLSFPVPSERYHPTQKPVELLSSVLSICSEQGDLVADPFTGSGSTAVACIREGRKFIGIERDAKYFDIACRRISDELKRPRLFAEPPPKAVQEAFL